jgi:hypothetical protein
MTTSDSRDPLGTAATEVVNDGQPLPSETATVGSESSGKSKMEEFGMRSVTW